MVLNAAGVEGSGALVLGGGAWEDSGALDGSAGFDVAGSCFWLVFGGSSLDVFGGGFGFFPLRRSSPPSFDSLKTTPLTDIDPPQTFSVIIHSFIMLSKADSQLRALRSSFWPMILKIIGPEW